MKFCIKTFPTRKISAFFVYESTPPDMLRNEAQAILVGTMASEGVFKAKELLLREMGL